MQAVLWCQLFLYYYVDLSQCALSSVGKYSSLFDFSPFLDCSCARLSVIQFSSVFFASGKCNLTLSPSLYYSCSCHLFFLSLSALKSLLPHLCVVVNKVASYGDWNSPAHWFGFCGIFYMLFDIAVLLTFLHLSAIFSILCLSSPPHLIFRIFNN